MDFEARKQKALAIMASRKMWKSNYGGRFRLRAK